jgi:hypothetical protein
VPGVTEFGQLIWGQAVYLRDAVAEIESGEGIAWRPDNILKLASFMELVNLNDCAYELIQYAGEKKMLTNFDVGMLLELLVPMMDGTPVTYADYVRNLERIANQPNTTSKSSGSSSIKRFLPGPLKTLIRKPLEKTRDVLDTVLDSKSSG